MKKTLSVFALSLTLVLAGCSGGKNNDDSAIKISEKTPTTKEGTLAKCLAEKGAIMYGTSWCGHCTQQKKDFKTESKEFLPFIDCEEQKGLCSDAKITAYPTWVLHDKTQLVGGQKLETLAEKTSCTY